MQNHKDDLCLKCIARKIELIHSFHIHQRYNYNYINYYINYNYNNYYINYNYIKYISD